MSKTEKTAPVKVAPKAVVVPNANVFIVGFYEVDGIGPVQVEAPSTQQGPEDYRRLAEKVALEHPGRPALRTGSCLELRNPEEDIGAIDLKSGLTFRQLFDASHSEEAPRTAIRVGTAFYQGQPYVVMLTYSRPKGLHGVILLPRVKSSGYPIDFGHSIATLSPVEGLPDILREILGAGCTLKLNVVTGGPK